MLIWASPAWIPALSAGLFGTTDSTRAPWSTLRLSTLAISGVRSPPLMPMKACSTWPLAISCWATSWAVSIGTAKPIPTLPSDWPPDSIWELIPITRPSESSSGPPELPGLIGASVWIALVIVKPFGASIWRWTAETIPAVAVRSRPNGLPIATTGSPTLTPAEEPSSSGWSWSAPEFDLQHRDVGRRVGADDVGVEGLAVLAADADGDVARSRRRRGCW